MLPNHSITTGSNPNIGKRKQSLKMNDSTRHHDTHGNSITANDCESYKRVNQLKSTKECDQHKETNQLISQLASREYSRTNESHRLEEETIQFRRLPNKKQTGNATKNASNKQKRM